MTEAAKKVARLVAKRDRNTELRRATIAIEGFLDGMGERMIMMDGRVKRLGEGLTALGLLMNDIRDRIMTLEQALKERVRK